MSGRPVVPGCIQKLDLVGTGKVGSHTATVREERPLPVARAQCRRCWSGPPGNRWAGNGAEPQTERGWRGGWEAQGAAPQQPLLPAGEGEPVFTAVTGCCSQALTRTLPPALPMRLPERLSIEPGSLSLLPTFHGTDSKATGPAPSLPSPPPRDFGPGTLIKRSKHAGRPASCVHLVTARVTPPPATAPPGGRLRPPPKLLGNTALAARLVKVPSGLYVSPAQCLSQRRPGTRLCLSHPSCSPVKGGPVTPWPETTVC